ncbi:MAG: mammalian cell entry protein [Mycobacterium sp.]
MENEEGGGIPTPAVEETSETSELAARAGDGTTTAESESRLTGLDTSPIRLGRIVGLGLVVALVVLCGWLAYNTNETRQDAHLRALLIQVAKQGAVNLTTIDYEHAERDVQRILDSATGQFHDDFQNRSAPFIEVVKQARSKSVGTVTEAGLESLDGEQGKVLVAVTVKTTSNGKAEEQPRYWRMRVTVAHEGDGAKISNVDFVP